MLKVVLKDQLTLIFKLLWTMLMITPLGKFIRRNFEQVYCLFVKVLSWVNSTYQHKLKSWAFLFITSEEASRQPCWLVKGQLSSKFPVSPPLRWTTW